MRPSNGHPEVWAFLTIVSFPVVLITTDILGAEHLLPFIYAILAVLAILTLEGIVRGKLWPFEPGYVEHISHPATPIRIVLFLGASLLILETALILVVITDRRSDIALLGLVLRKQCAAASYDPLSHLVCKALKEPRDANGHVTRPTTDAVSLGVRNAAATSWFPNESLVTCAERPIVRSIPQEESYHSLSLAHCTAWSMNENGHLVTKASTTKHVGAYLTKDSNGFYHASKFSDDYNATTWVSALGTLATHGRDYAETAVISSETVTILQAEALGRAQELLRK